MTFGEPISCEKVKSLEKDMWYNRFWWRVEVYALKFVARWEYELFVKKEIFQLF